MADEKFISTTTTISLTKLYDLFPKILQGFKAKIPKVLTDEIVASIQKGISPVEGQGRFQKYSDSYSRSIQAGLFNAFGKKTRPVNLTLSGQLLGSIFTKDADTGTTVGFSDEKAGFHNDQGAGKAKTVRRMLPTKSGETFSRPIMQRVMKTLQNEIIQAEIDRTNNG